MKSTTDPNYDRNGEWAGDDSDELQIALREIMAICAVKNRRRSNSGVPNYYDQIWCIADDALARTTR